MPLRSAAVCALLCSLAHASSGSPPAGEYARHWAALSQLSVAVAQAMPAAQFDFRPHPESMDFGQLMSHIATTNFQFCAGLKDVDPPPVSTLKSKDEIVNVLNDSFQYCSNVIAGMTEEQLEKAHNSPDGKMPGRDVLLAMYIHVAHHRGQAEIYLRDKGIKPPQYRI